ncbi:MAG: ferrous iron transport protein B [Bacteroidales bacterium]|nr:ferrous iron transport protein B [Bacteroidales bacterium]
MTLAQMPAGSRCVIARVHGHGGFRHRIQEMGFVKGKEVDVLKNAPLMDPIEYRIMGSHISLRRSEAANIEVVPLDRNAHPDYQFHGTIEEHVQAEVLELDKKITVALVGNPNCGKTSFFNHATGMREKVGNYSGVTVDAKTGIFHHKGYTIYLVDLPGTYSLTEYSPEELYVRDFLIEHHPDLVLNIVDAGNLERNLFLTTQLIDLNLPMVMALNMYDELEASGDKLDIDSLSQMLGFSIIPTVSKTGKGLEDVLDAIITLYRNGTQSKHIHINYGDDTEQAIAQVKALALANQSIRDRYHGRYVALKLIENDSVIHRELSSLPNYPEIRQTADKCREHLEKIYHDDISAVISDLKYGFIRGALSETLTHSKEDKRHMQYALDTVLTNRWMGFPILILFMWIMFQTTFTLGAYPQDWLEEGIAWLGEFVGRLLPAGMLNDLLTDGIIAGVGGVLVFLPNILILFLFISILEDSGYMARAAFIMDKLMHKIGLHGKSFIPYLIGFGCSVPAIMATRTLENRKDRILTILTVPFFSCSARLPVYLLLVGAFFSRNQGLVLLSIYLVGILIAIITALLFKKLAFKDENDHFVMELPPYRLPTMRNTLIHMWDKSVQYLKKMGTVILFASIIIWALSYFPHREGEDSMVQMEQSYIGRLGQLIEPAVKPLGFDWKMGASLLTGLSAKEIVVSTMGILYQGDGDVDETSSSLQASLQNQYYEDGSPVFTPLVAYAFMIFILLYCPCIATITAISKEAGRRWAWIAVLYQIGVAWLASFLVYQVGGLLL